MYAANLMQVNEVRKYAIELDQISLRAYRNQLR